jgi:O-antigen ligase
VTGLELSPHQRVPPWRDRGRRMPPALRPPAPPARSISENKDTLTAKVGGTLVSFEMLFLLFIFAGDFKKMSVLSWFPVDFTLFFLVISFAAAIVIILRQSNRFNNLDDIAIMLYILFLCWALWSLVWSSFGEYNINKATKTSILVSWCFVGSYFIVAAQWHRVTKFIMVLIGISTALLAYWSYSRFVLGIVDERTGATEAGNYLNYAFHAKYLIAIFTALAVASQGFVRLLMCIVAVVAVLVLMLFIGARGPLLWALFTVPLALFFLLVNGHARHHRTRSLSIVLGFILVVGIMAFSLMWAGTQLVERLSPEMKTVERLKSYYEPEFGESAGGRIHAQLFALESWLEAPIIGWGIGEFNYLYPGGPEGSSPERRFSYPHNLFLEVLMEEGLVGFGLLAALTGLGLVRAWKLWPPGRPQWPVIALILLYIPQLLSRAFDQGFLSDERALFAFLGLILGLGHRAVDRAGAA